MRSKGQAGFTLVEVMIALTLMALAFGTILTIQGQATKATERAQQAQTVAMLARNLMIDTELLMEGKAFNEVKEEESGAFEAPYQDYRWKREVKQIEFPSLNIAGGGGSQGSSGGKSGDGASGSGGDNTGDMVGKLVSTFFSKAMREIKVTVTWNVGGGDRSYVVSTYWVDLNHEFQLSQ